MNCANFESSFNSRPQYEKIEDSIMEENIDEIEIESSVKHFDESSPSRFARNNNSVDKYKNRPNRFENYPKFNIEGSYDVRDKILVNDGPTLEVIKEHKPRQSKMMNNKDHRKMKEFKTNSNYRKRVVEVERQK